MFIYRLRSFEEYMIHLEKQQKVLEKRYQHLTKLENDNKNKEFSIEGFSITAEKQLNSLWTGCIPREIILTGENGCCAQ